MSVLERVFLTGNNVQAAEKKCAFERDVRLREVSVKREFTVLYLTLVVGFTVRFY